MVPWAGSPRGWALRIAPCLALLSWLGACIVPEDPRDLRDQDQDGYPAWLDCDDLDPDVRPRADELCNGVDDDCDGEIDDDGVELAWYVDQDDDGWGEGPVVGTGCSLPEDRATKTGDCGQLEPDVHPGAEERCNGADDDCDGDIDDDPVDGVDLWADLDGDGYGDPAILVHACAGTAGLVEDDQDCQDANADIHPGGTEICDELDEDEDCDGLADDHDPDASGQSAVYLDRDGDGAGDSEASIQACDAPIGYAADGGDCDDLDASVGAETLGYADDDGDGYGDPGELVTVCSGSAGYATRADDCDDDDASRNPAASEAWYDGVDQDCDGHDDYDADRDGQEAAEWGGLDCDDADSGTCLGCAEVYHDGLDEDCLGGDDDDADQDGYTAADYGGDDCDDADELIFPGSTALGYPEDCDCDGEAELDGATWTDASGSYDLGQIALAAAGDVDGDGLGDLVVGAPLTAADSGAVVLVAGPAADGLDDPVAVVEDDECRLLGEAVLGAGDLDGDGYDDLAFSARSYMDSGTGEGTVAVASGPLSGLSGLDAASVVEGDGISGKLGAALAVEDIDGDGSDEIVAGAPYAEWADVHCGVVYALSADAPGVVSDVALATVGGNTAGQFFGAALDTLGDTDGDGLDDLAAGAESISGARGQVWLIPGPLPGDADVADVGTRISGAHGGDKFGAALAGGADLDGDGRDDLLVGAPSYDLDTARNAGGAWVFLGPVLAETDTDGASAVLAFDTAGAAVGSAVDLLPDPEVDGLVDAVVAGPGIVTSGGTTGEVWVLPAPVAGTWERADARAFLRGASSSSGAGEALAAVGDLDGDGSPELAVSATGDGAILLLWGGW